MCCSVQISWLIISNCRAKNFIHKNQQDIFKRKALFRLMRKGLSPLSASGGKKKHRPEAVL